MLVFFTCGSVVPGFYVYCVEGFVIYLSLLCSCVGFVFEDTFLVLAFVVSVYITSVVSVGGPRASAW